MRTLWWVALAVFAIVLMAFAVSNRETVTLGLWPLPDVLELPVYLLVLVTLLVGFVVGELAGWTGGRRWRREVRRQRERVAILEGELEAERARPVVAPPGSAPVSLAPPAAVAGEGPSSAVSR